MAGLLALAPAQPGERIADGIDRGANGFCLCLHQVDWAAAGSVDTNRSFSSQFVYAAFSILASPNAVAGTNTSPANSSRTVRMKLPPLMVIASPSPVVTILRTPWP